MRIRTALFIAAAFGLAALWSQSKPTKVTPGQVKAQVAFFSNDVFDLRTNPNAINSFNLTGVPADPTLATVSVFVDGKLLLEGSDYSVVPQPGTYPAVQTTASYTGSVVQIRYYKAN